MNSNTRAHIQSVATLALFHTLMTVLLVTFGASVLLILGLSFTLLHLLAVLGGLAVVLVLLVLALNVSLR